MRFWGYVKINYLIFDECQTVRKMFEKAGQTPRYGDGDDLFVEHLNKLKENAHFKREVTDNVENNSHVELDIGNRVKTIQDKMGNPSLGKGSKLGPFF